MSKHVQHFGKMTYEIEGIRKEFVGDLYHTLMRSSWWTLLLAAFGLYVGSAILFAFLLSLGPGHVQDANNITDLFWFSVQTLSTIGYGKMHPITPWAHGIVLLESFMGLVEGAIVTAVLFAKFSRPKARVAFAEKAVLFESQGQYYLQIRFANARGFPIVNASITLAALINQEDVTGRPMRRLITIPVMQPNIPFFGLSFTATHCLSNGVFAGMSLEEMHERLFLLIVSFQGIDQILEQEVREQYFYSPDQIVEHARYEDMVHAHKWGAHMDLSKISNIQAEDINEIPDTIAEQIADQMEQDNGHSSS